MLRYRVRLLQPRFSLSLNRGLAVAPDERREPFAWAEFAIDSATISGVELLSERLSVGEVAAALIDTPGLPTLEAIAALESSLSAWAQREGVGESVVVGEARGDVAGLAASVVETLSLQEARTDILLAGGVEIVVEQLGFGEAGTATSATLAARAESLGPLEALTDRAAFAGGVLGESLAVAEAATARQSAIEICVEPITVAEIGQVWLGETFGGPFTEAVLDYFTPAGTANHWLEVLTELVPLASASAIMEFLAEPVSVLEAKDDRLAVVVARSEGIGFGESGGEARHTTDALSEVIPLATVGGWVETLSEYIPLGS